MTADLFAWAGVSVDAPEFAGVLSKHPLYRVWNTMLQRCENPDNAAFEDYGARGIGVCDAWRSAPRVFIGWALANGWEKGLHLDRRDNAAGYEPENCRFVTAAENNLNKRTTLRGGDGVPVVPVGVPLQGNERRRFMWRVRSGWPVDVALAVPCLGTASNKPKPSSLASRAKACGLPASTVYERVRAGWSLEETFSVPRYGRRAKAKSALL